MGIVLVGTSHKTDPVEVRERLAFAESRLAGALRDLVDCEMISEGLIVSTCNRVELIAATPKGVHATENAVSRLYDFLSRFHQYDLSLLQKHCYYLAGQAAIKHVFRVTSSLDSMVVGEPQITGQIKEAFQRAQEAAVVGHELTRLMNRAFAVAKRVRNETGIGSSAVSISFVAVELARKVFEDLKGSAVMLLGAGEMAELAAKHLLNYGASSAISPAPSSITALPFRSSKTLRASSTATKLIETALDPMPVSLRTRLATAKARFINRVNSWPTTALSCAR